MPVGPVMKEHALRFEQSQPHIPQRLALLTLILLSGHKVHLRPLPQGPVLLGAKGLPAGLPDLAQRCGQGRAHAGADRKANPPPRFLFPVRILEPIHLAPYAHTSLRAQSPPPPIAARSRPPRCQRSSSRSPRSCATLRTG